MGGRKTSVISSWTCGLRNNSNISVIPFSIIALPLLTLYEYTKLFSTKLNRIGMSIHRFSLKIFHTKKVLSCIISMIEMITRNCLENVVKE